MAYRVLINSVDRTEDVIANTIFVDDQVNDKVNSLDFSLINNSGSGIPEVEDEVIIYLDDDSKLFGGNITSVNMNKKNFGEVTAQIRCSDYTRLMDRNLVHVSYEGMTDLEIIEALVDTYCSDLGITTTNVVEGVTISQITFNYIQMSQVMRKLTELTGRNWYIDYDKDIHYFPANQTAAPFNITSSGNEYENLRIKKDGTQLKNRIYVRGGTNLSDFTAYAVKGDGVARQFPLPDKPHDVSVEVNGTPKTLGIKNIDTTGYDWYLNYHEKYIEQDSGGTLLTTSDTLEVTYKYDIPILIAQEDSTSIEDNGVREFAIFDKTILTTDAARDRAIAELTDYKNSIIEGSFDTWETGLVSGQYININHADYGVNDDYVIQKVQARSIGGGVFKYNVSIASSKTMGIIKFLLELLEANRNLVELDPNEVVDELFSVADALLSDSLVDSVTDSLGAAPYKWSNDGGSTTNKLQWDLGQWA